MKKILLGMMMLISLSNNYCFAAAKTSAQKLDTIVAIVNDGVVTQNQLNQQIAVIKQQAAQNHAQLPPADVLRKQVLQHLIDVDIQLQMAKQSGIKISSTDVDTAIKHIADRAHLSIAQLRQKVQEAGLSYPQYRKNIRKQMTIAQLQQAAIGKGITVTKQEVDAYLKNAKTPANSNVEYHVKNIMIPLTEAPTTEQVQHASKQGDAIVKKLKAGATFSSQAMANSSGETALQGGDLGWRNAAALPDIFEKYVVTMKQGQIIGPIRTANGFHIIKLVGIRDANSTQSVTLYHLRHILLTADEQHSIQQEKQEIEKIRQKLVKGARFSQLAKQYSQDQRSAAQGGDLGWVHIGEVPNSFNNAMQTLKPGQISQPIQTENGWSLIEVIARKKVAEAAGVAQQQQIREYLYQRKFNDKVQNWLQQMRASAYVKIM